MVPTLPGGAKQEQVAHIRLDPVLAAEYPEDPGRHQPAIWVTLGLAKLMLYDGSLDLFFCGHNLPPTSELHRIANWILFTSASLTGGERVCGLAADR